MWCHPGSRVAVPPITCQSHPLPSSHGGDQGGLQSQPGDDGAGWEHLPTAPRPGCGSGCGLPSQLCGEGLWTGPWLMWGCSSVVPAPTVRVGGGLSIPCWLSIPPVHIPPGSGSSGPALAPSKQPAMVEPCSSPSIILIRRRWQPGGPWQRGCTDGRPEPWPRDRREHRGDKSSQTKTTTPLLGASKRRAEI